MQSFVKDGSIDGTGAVRRERQPTGKPPTKIILSCHANTTVETCHWAPHAISSPSPSPLPSPAQITKTKQNSSSLISCPNFFRYIHEDLKPWKSTGITKEMVESAKQFANFRLLIIDGKAYMEKYRNAFQTRDIFTIWGILQLLNRYPGRIPDLDLMFNCGDTPVVKAANYQTKALPPLFRYCTDGTSVEIVFPDWSFWGW
jgi:Glycosyl transferase family 90